MRGMIHGTSRSMQGVIGLYLYSPFMCYPQGVRHTLCHIIWRVVVSRSQSPPDRFPSPRQVSYLPLGAYFLLTGFHRIARKLRPSRLSLSIFNQFNHLSSLISF